VSFSIRPGEVLGLIGPNGSGKTTLFECLGGVLPADSGAIAEDGRALTAAERKARVFYLPDAIAPWPSQTVRWALDFITGFFGENFARLKPSRYDHERDDDGPADLDRSAKAPAERVLPRSAKASAEQVVARSAKALAERVPARSAKALAERIDDVVGQLDLEPLMDSPIGTLSKGQRKRALLAIGLLTPQPILLADEPFDGLDLRQTREVAQTLRAHAAGGRTMFLSIHQINDAARVCDRFVLLSGGRVRGEGTLDELSRRAGQTPREGGQPERGDLEEVFLALT
jgi:ABC-type multidrug transport system ATPase subunit